jgi:two-component system phosphate regulon response regulator PhoB
MPEGRSRILVVEDEREIRELMALHLLRQSYVVKECATAEEAMREVDQNQFSLVVLDWMLPGLSGLDFMGYLQRKSQPPSVLMVTAKTEPQDIVQGLERGADDYLTKPFDPSIFLARVKAMLRRTQMGPKNSAPERLELAGLVINFATYEVLINSEKLHLTPSEYKLLTAMVAHRGKVLTRDRLIENIQGEGINVVGRTIDTHVFGLRKKLGEWGDNIETIRGVGYRVKLE